MNKMFPDQYMMKTFEMCSHIYYSKSREKYIMLSTGSNDFDMTRVWKILIKNEIEYSFLYNWYVSPKGFSTLNYFIQLYHNFMAVFDYTSHIHTMDSCLCLGASQAAYIVFSYLHSIKAIKAINLIGYNYSLFERLARYFKLNIKEIFNLEPFPTVSEVLQEKICDSELYILTIPNNPTGEMWTQSELELFLRKVKLNNAYCLIDLVPFSLISNRSIINVEKAILTASAEDNVIITNSFSKTDSVPGFRLGYIYGNKNLIEYAENYISIDMMNGPCVPIFPMVFTLIFRIIYISQKEGINISIDNLLRFSRQIIDTTLAIPNIDFYRNLNKLFEKKNFMELYYDYIEEQLSNEAIILDNKNFLLTHLDKYIIKNTNLMNGFNILIMFIFDIDEEFEFQIELLNKTQISLLTESCFHGKERKEKKCWVRFSLAKDKEIFREGIKRLKIFLDGKCKL